MRASRAILLSMLLVASAVAPGVAMGQTATETATPTPTPTDSTDSNVYEKTITGSPEHVVVNQKDIDGEFTVEISTEDGPSGERLVLARERVGSGTEKYIQFNNAGAYENVTAKVTVHGSGNPSFGDGSDKGFDIAYVIGATGGDRDLTCDTAERLKTMGVLGITIVDCSTLPGTTSINTTGLDAQQIKLDTYQSAQNQNASAEIYHTTHDNLLEGAKTQARIAGKNAYIRALNNGSSKSAATTAAKVAVEDHYATLQVNLLKEWNAQVAHARYLTDTLKNESGIDWKWLHAGQSKGASSNLPGIEVVSGSNVLWDEQYDSVKPEYYSGTRTVTLVNGSTMQVLTVENEIYEHSGGADTAWTVGPTDGPITRTVDGNDFRWKYMSVPGYDTDADRIRYLDFAQYSGQFSEIESQESTVRSDMDILASNTYDAYQQGEINNSDLIDPYLYSQEFSPGSEYQGWAASQLTMMGANGPKTLDDTGYMNITTQSGAEYKGILMSQENPATGQFETNTTYDPAQINGTQWVVTDGQTHELQEPFEITDIQTTDGETRQNITIQKTTYEEADVNTTELQQSYEDLSYIRSMIEARQQSLGGGGGGLFGQGTVSPTVALIAVAVILGLGALN